MHVNISREPLHTEIYTKMPWSSLSQKADTHFVRACAAEKHFSTSQEPLYTEIYMTNSAPQNLGPHFARACAVQMHVSTSQGPLYTEMYRKSATPIHTPEPRTTVCASLRSWNACQHVTRATLYVFFFEKCRSPAWAQNADTHFARAWAVEMHFNISQEHVTPHVSSSRVASTKISKWNAMPLVRVSLAFQDSLSIWSKIVQRQAANISEPTSLRKGRLLAP